MQNLDLSVIKQLLSWLQQGETAWLCTVIRTWGSAPRLPGSLLVCNSKGQTVGSLSGGCVEDDLIERLCNGQLAADGVDYTIYGETEQDIERFKLPCGGTLGVLIEPLGPQQIANYQAIESALLQRKTICRQQQWHAEQGTIEKTEILPTDKAPGVALEFNDQGNPKRLTQVYGPTTHVFIIGVSEVSRALAQFALAADFRVTVCDPRPEFISQWTIDNTQLVKAMPDDAIRQYANDAATAIVALTHDPRIDDMGLMDAFGTDAFYIGAMGSKKTSAKRRERLQELGVSEQHLQRLHAPIGLDIRSKTPAEIAIAIIAELIAVRAAKR